MKNILIISSLLIGSQAIASKECTEVQDFLNERKSSILNLIEHAKADTEEQKKALRNNKARLNQTIGLLENASQLDNAEDCSYYLAIMKRLLPGLLATYSGG